MTETRHAYEDSTAPEYVRNHWRWPDSDTETKTAVAKAIAAQAAIDGYEWKESTIIQAYLEQYGKMAAAEKRAALRARKTSTYPVAGVPKPHVHLGTQHDLSEAASQLTRLHGLMITRDLIEAEIDRVLKLLV